MTFDQLGLRAELIDAVTSKGYDTPSPIQERAIPAILEGRDVLGGAQTGTGKTAAFGLPLLQRLSGSGFNHKRPRALVLTPTRELASQVHQSLVDYGKNLRLRSTVIFGGVGFQPQLNALRRGIDILVATPGRLLDLCQRGEANLTSIEILVLDEADRMLDMGFIHDIRRIIKLMPAERQNLMFSATYAPDVKKLADGILRNPVEVEVARRSAVAELVDQEAYLVSQKSKREVLCKMIQDGNWNQVLVFTRTKHGANRLAQQLIKEDISALAIHGNKSQGARERALENFKNLKTRVLVATDIAARGLDIAKLPHVVNYELPNVPEDYVHRIGRTGRAGTEGKAISLVCESETEYLESIEQLLKRELPLYTINSKGERREVQDRPRASPQSKGGNKPRQRSQRPQGQGQGRPNGDRQNGGHQSGGRTASGNRRRGPSNRSGKPSSPSAPAAAPAASSESAKLAKRNWFGFRKG